MMKNQPPMYALYIKLEKFSLVMYQDKNVLNKGKNILKTNALEKEIEILVSIMKQFLKRKQSLSCFFYEF